MLRIVNHWKSLPLALEELESWERDAEFFGYGTAYLGFKGSHWVVLVTPNLINAVRPF
jgi:hypothetical protein